MFFEVIYACVRIWVWNFTHATGAPCFTIVTILCIEESQQILELFVIRVSDGVWFHDVSPLLSAIVRELWALLRCKVSSDRSLTI